MAHADLAERVKRARLVVTEGVTPAQYTETTRILEVMSGNVAAAIGAPPPSG
jgi:hypothetical protein